MNDRDEVQEFDLDDILREFRQEPAGEEAAEEPSGEKVTGEAPADEPARELPAGANPQEESGEAAAEEPASAGQDTVRLDDLSQVQAAEPPKPRATILELNPKARLRELKKKLIAGPEKRYYEISELGVGKLQTAVFLNLVIVLLCA